MKIFRNLILGFVIGSLLPCIIGCNSENISDISSVKSDLSLKDSYQSSSSKGWVDNSNRYKGYASVDLFAGDNLPAAAESALNKIEEKEHLKGEVYPRKRVEIITGKPLNARITLQQVKDIIKQEKTYESIMEKIDAIHSLPDVDAGSGIQRLEYWLDDEGTEMIEIWLRQIQYKNTKDSVKNELLYKPS